MGVGAEASTSGSRPVSWISNVSDKSQLSEATTLSLTQSEASAERNGGRRWGRGRRRTGGNSRWRRKEKETEDAAAAGRQRIRRSPGDLEPTGSLLLLLFLLLLRRRRRRVPASEEPQGHAEGVEES